MNFQTIKKSLLITMFMLFYIGASAQTTALRQAVTRYGKVTTVEAKAVRIRHNSALKSAPSETGRLVIRKPDKVNISVNSGKDQLNMDGTTFTMVVKGKKHVTDSRKNHQFATFQKVLEYIITGGKTGNLPSANELSVQSSGNKVILTVTPQQAKKSRRQMFSSFILTIDKRNSELLSLRMNQRKGNYTEYKFSDFKFK